MNLRETFIWNLSILCSVIALLYCSYTNYTTYKEYMQLQEEYDTETPEMDEKLLNKITDLEDKLKNQAAYKYKFDKDPTDLSRIIKIEGMEKNFGGTGNDGLVLSFIYNTKDDKKWLDDDKTVSNPNYGEPFKKAYVTFKNKDYNLVLGDTINNGAVVEINADHFILLKDNGDEKTIKMPICNFTY